MRTAIVLPLLALISIVTTMASAQETRAEVIAGRQAAKATRLTAPKAQPIEGLLVRVEEEQWFTGVPRGFFPMFGNMMPGAGLALGVAHRTYTGPSGWIQGRASYSVRNFKLLEGETQYPELAGGRLALGARLRWSDAPSVMFNGLGQHSTRDRVSFGLRQTEIGGTATVRPARWLFAAGGLAVEAIENRRGSRFAPIDERFAAAEIPGFGSSPTYIHTNAAAGVDSRTTPGYSQHGGLYRVTMHDYRARGGDARYDFQRLDADVVQLVPILRANWILALRGRVALTGAADADTIPFYMLPTLGGSTSLRGYPDYRFRDRHTLLLSGEFRWTPADLLDMAIFWDGGKVASRTRDLSLRGLHTDVGVGARIHAPSATILRLEVARGHEGLRFLFSFSPSF